MAMMPTPGRPPKPLDPSSGLISSEDERELDHLRLWAAPSASGTASTVSQALEALLEDFTRRWDQGEQPRAEQFFDRLPPDDPEAPLELIYHEFCLQASSERRPSVEDFVRRFPEYRDRLLRLIALHEVLPPISIGKDQALSPLKPGDEVGPYRLIREMGRGGFAHVYLAADAELEDRLLVLKVTDRPSAEHRYLARAPHPHIVPILRERITDDGLQLIFMPFVGGATLGDVLQESRRRSRRPERGLDLLADLDLCSAPEYTAATPVRPARELLASLSFAGAVAWVIARLAEALDHAYQRGVIHGDLKPSNILIGGDGQPMLFDFNLSTDWLPASLSRTSGELGGTLAYMAPERLRALASPETASPPCPSSCHQADLYALGLILREALTGAPPSVPSPDESPRSGRALAALLAANRSAGDPASRRDLVSIPPGLRAILRRCLAPDPTHRYRFASQLAVDLDRWRSGLPLLHTSPPAWVEASRWLRYHQRPFLAAACCITLGLIASGAAALVHDDRTTQLQHASAKEDELSKLARQKYEAFVSDPNSGSYEVWAYRIGERSQSSGKLDFAERVLTSYGLLDGSSADSWNNHDITRLGEPAQSDTLGWVLGHALVYAIELSRDEYDAFPEVRERALSCVDRILQAYPIAPLQLAANRLHEKHGGNFSIVQGSNISSPPAWLNAYLDGILAEAVTPAEAEAIGVPPSEVSLSYAINRYHAALKDRPDLYWPRYRLATALTQIGDVETAKDEFGTCLVTHPQAAILWLGQGSCQYYLDDIDRAIESYHHAVRITPRWTVAWRALAMLGARIGRPDLIEQAIRRIRPSESSPSSEAWRSLRIDLFRLLGHRATSFIDLDASSVPVILASKLIEAPSNLELRNEVAKLLLKQGRLQEALDHYNRILKLEPGHLSAQFDRAVTEQRMGNFRNAIEGYKSISKHENVSEFIDKEPTGLMSFVLLSAHEARQGNSDAALDYAKTAVSYAETTKSYRGESYYALARAHATAANDDPSQLIHAAAALAAARDKHAGFIENVFYSDPMLDSKRAELAELLGGVEF
ncbi:protein kinase domain-containing protein [Tautonia rosea]|uniref:serine/threonine-protein kinase n=1 Tax=Tautonia rosea TaxID=2728037 RepID=UPI00147395D0|nr:serine/threonine-protein kinase [Tautonia rosea]